MEGTLTYKIIRNHLINGLIKKGNEIKISIDQTLTQDSTGTMVYLQLEALNISKIKTKKSIAYIDHNTLQTGPENIEDHNFIKSICLKYGIFYSNAGNGICHQIHLERFGIPGMTLLGSDSHTPTLGSLGIFAIGVGGLDLAVSIAKGYYYFKVPKICKINLKGKLRKGVSAKDIVLEILRLKKVKGGYGKIFEYQGDGLKFLSINQRATICNMGAELGLTTSIFPSDDITKDYFKNQNRGHEWKEIKADKDAIYDEEIIIDLNKIEPLIAKPHSPDNVVEVKKLEKTKINQVIIGSCTNSSFEDLIKVASILKNKTINKDVNLFILPGSKQVLLMLSKCGALFDLINSGARILESNCGPCIGAGQVPGKNEISIRTFNRNFKGRCGNVNAKVYLTSPETAAFSAFKGYIYCPLKKNYKTKFKYPVKFLINDEMILKPKNDCGNKMIMKGSNIKPIPLNKKLNNRIKKNVLIKLNDGISTDDLLPSDAKLLPFRSNIPYLANYYLKNIDPNFYFKTKKNNGGIIIAGFNYGQGSSREHAALIPMYLGIKFIIAKSFARIHYNNLINVGIIPLIFDKQKDFNKIDENDILVIENIFKQLKDHKKIKILNKTKKILFKTKNIFSNREIEILISGGLLNYEKNKT